MAWGISQELGAWARMGRMLEWRHPLWEGYFELCILSLPWRARSTWTMPWSCRCCGAQGSSPHVLEAGAVAVGWRPEDRREEMQSQVRCSSLENTTSCVLFGLLQSVMVPLETKGFLWINIENTRAKSWLSHSKSLYIPFFFLRTSWAHNFTVPVSSKTMCLCTKNVCAEV